MSGKLVPVMAALLGAAALASSIATTPADAQHAVKLPAPRADVARTAGLQTAILAGGCFWGMEEVFEHVKGVRTVTAGYAGGSRETANYEAVSTERTGHAEAIRIVYDPRQISYGTLLRIYFSVAHDPTEVNRQGPDTGPSYRSAIFPQTPDQARVARAYIDQLGRARVFSAPLATKVEAGAFFPAEAYHQDFARRNPSHPYIVRWDKPKLAAFRVAYPQLAG